jgi:hypothetical protein
MIGRELAFARARAYATAPSFSRHQQGRKQMDALSLYWKNATADAVGDKHGVSDKELKSLAPRIKTIHNQMRRSRKAGKLRFRDPPYDEDMVAAVNKQVEHFATAAKC